MRFSRSGRPVDRDEHLAWLRERLADPFSHLWIGEAAQRPVGQVRVDWQEDAWLVSIAVAPAARGRGLAGRLLRRLQEEMSSGGGTGVLRAEVHPGNTASLSVFESVGFVAAGRSADLVSYRWEW